MSSGLQQLNKIRKDFSKELSKKPIDDIVKYLSKIGDEELAKAFLGKGFNNITYNLRDSYAWAVYEHGELKEYGFLGDEKATQKYKNLKGREEAIKFINRYNASKKGYELIFIAAMPYASALEDYNNIKVLSSITDNLEVIFGSDKVSKI